MRPFSLRENGLYELLFANRVLPPTITVIHIFCYRDGKLE